MKYRLIVIAIVLMSVLTACSGGDDAGSSDTSGASFTITVTGDTEFTLTPDNATSLFSGDDGENMGGMATSTLWFGDEDGRIASVVFYNIQKPEAGDYEIVELDLTSDDVVLAGLVIDGEDGKTYTNSNDTGTVSLSAEGDTYSGSFEYTIADPLSNAEITVSGEFSGVTYK